MLTLDHAQHLGLPRRRGPSPTLPRKRPASGRGGRKQARAHARPGMTVPIRVRGVGKSKACPRAEVPRGYGANARTALPNGPRETSDSLARRNSATGPAEQAQLAIP